MSPLQTLGYLENNTLGHCTEENLPPTNYTVRYLVHNTIHRVSTVHYYLVYVVQCLHLHHTCYSGVCVYVSAAHISLHQSDPERLLTQHLSSHYSHNQHKETFY